MPKSIAPEDRQRITLETLDNLNRIWNCNSNVLPSTRSGEVNPEKAYIELVRELLTVHTPP